MNKNIKHQPKEYQEIYGKSKGNKQKWKETVGNKHEIEGH